MKMGWVGGKQTAHSKEQGTEKGARMKTSMAEGAKQRTEVMFGRSRKSNRSVKFGQKYKTHEKHGGRLDLMPTKSRKTGKYLNSRSSLAYSGSQ